MKLADATLSLAPTDLSNHLACQHVTMLELAAARGERTRPSAGLLNQQALQEKGLAHEAAYVAHLRAQGLSVTDLRGAPMSEAGFEQTRAAMRAGVDVIVQAPLLHAPAASARVEPTDAGAARDTAVTTTASAGSRAGAGSPAGPRQLTLFADNAPDSRVAAPPADLPFTSGGGASLLRETTAASHAVQSAPDTAPAAAAVAAACASANAATAPVPARWSGRADVLRRVDVPSALGSWSYEVIDTKLARDTRGSALLQLCTYSAIVHAIQERMPARVHIVSPGESAEEPFETHTFRLDDYLAYYRAVRARFEAVVQAGDTNATYPEPTPLCDVCRWWSVCDTRRRADDHLSLVAGVTRLQIHELQQRDVATLERLALLPSPLPFKPARGSAESLNRTQAQARVQLDGRRAGRGIYELLPLERDRGLSRLPPPSPGDIFFDLEGDPFVGAAGHEYLFGWAARDLDRASDAAPGASAADFVYTSHWAADAASEKAAFESFIAFVNARLARHPDLHIYHYAPYESAALRRLMGRHATCEADVDRLLRGNILVDLHTIVRQSVRASVERYSIKELETFYAFTRATPLRDAAAALRHVEYLLETGQPLPADDPARQTIEHYNRDDCLSAAALRDWLEARRAEHEAAGHIVMRPVPPPADPSEALSEKQAQVRALMDTLLAGVPDAPDERTPEQQGRWLLAHLLDFHRREEKAAWWEFYRLADLPEEERRDESKALVDLTLVGTVGGTAKSPVMRYAFAPQECDIRPGDDLYITPDQRFGKVEALDRDARLVDIKKAMKAAQIHPSSVFGFSLVRSDVLADALLRLGTTVARDGFAARAACDLLLRREPRLAPGTAWRLPAETTVARARRLALALDGGVLPIQGPPGAGKTYAGARIICGLVAAGKKVGVTGPNHSVISNLLDGVAKAAVEEGLRVRCIQKAKDDAADAAQAPRPSEADAETDPVIRQVMKNPDVLAALQDGSAQVGAGTPWLWAREEFADAVDVLVIDEAGQMSLANALAMTGAARSIVLLGDPQQLEQPLQGSHPDGAAVSVLQHMLGDHPTVPEASGLFLDETWRLHPAICAFTSELFYETRLASHAGLGGQRLEGDTPLAGAGLWFHPVAHTGNQNSAPEEVEAIAQLVAHLLARPADAVSGSGNAAQSDGTRSDASRNNTSAHRHADTRANARPAADGSARGTPDADVEATAGAEAGADAGASADADARLADAGADATVTTGPGSAAPHWIDASGASRPLTLNDILIVAPYNAQVYAIRDRLPGARAGTVDRFQGQEAPIVIYSMTTSTPEDAPRGMEFLYSLNRLNVATSRAQGLVILVASPRLLEPDCQTPRQMRLANAFCRYVELAQTLTADALGTRGGN